MNYLQKMSSIHLTIDSQFGSPGYSAYHCIVSALESTTRKIIGFMTVKKVKPTINLLTQNQLVLFNY